MGLTAYIVLLFSLSVHESAHAWMAHKMGDDTALALGRVSLNPIVHIDPIGSLLFPLVQIFTGIPTLGWAKPTPYNPANFRREVSMGRGHVMVAGAGPLSNLALALLFVVALFGVTRLGLVTQANLVLILLATGIQLNLALALFNLVPLPPLDGSRVVAALLPPELERPYSRLERWGLLILLVLMFSGVLSWLLGPPVRGLIEAVSVLFNLP